MKIEIVILNYNGGELFLECLQTIVDAAEKSVYRPRVVVLDNKSQDESHLEAKRRYPDIDVFNASENLVLCSFNEYLAQSHADISILMNNDIKVAPNFVDPLIQPFLSAEDTFMVTPKCLSFDGQEFEGGVTKWKMHYGIFWAHSRFRGHEKYLNTFSPTMSAGFGAFDRQKFLELGGYDDLYFPGRLEDSDLGFRAYKKGWKLFCEPKSVVYHKGAVSFDKEFTKSGTLKINFRNTFLFMWKNLSASYLLIHVFFLPARLLWALIAGPRELFTGFCEALSKLGQALKKRKSLPKSPFSDQAIFDLVKEN